ncbi:hypothetical protein [Nannocystis punicea]|uniref:Tetratricopeptide repeat protein n=1 Tax=Nannocystis punicea TaxID=2995304 RepID=A0ABY7H8F1_9BACT|nr:hypothetical protein [Nannocystis poenicansa]WAS95547.1 hypothetical protein O0S08_05240 [Nannocystis poenicansa]
MEELDRSAHELLREYRVEAGLDAPARTRVWRRLEGSIETCPIEQAPPARRPRGQMAAAVVIVSLAAAILLLVCDRRGLLASGRGDDAEAAAYAASGAGETRELERSSRPKVEAAEPTSPELEAATAASVAPEANDAPARPRGPRVGPRVRGGVIESQVDKDMSNETGSSGQSSLAAELELLRRARAALDGGDAAGALQDLAGHERAFAAGQMLQDRLLLRMEALCALGKGRQARAEAAVFLRAYPGSTHIARVQTICPESSNVVTD